MSDWPVMSVEEMAKIIQDHTRCASMEFDESKELATAIIKAMEAKAGGV